MSQPNESQIDYWNGRAGEKWAAMQISLDRMLSPAMAKLAECVGPISGKRILDIGCGTGETCAVWMEGGADVTGIDVSAPMLAVAAKRTAGKAKIVEADASTWMGEAPFDIAVSRFGVMFSAYFANNLIAMVSFLSRPVPFEIKRRRLFYVNSIDW